MSARTVRCGECDACQEWILEPDSAPRCTEPKPALKIDADQKRQARKILGKTIAKVVLTPCGTSAGGECLITQCTIQFTDGSSLRFVTTEEENAGDYGVDICYPARSLNDEELRQSITVSK